MNEKERKGHLEVKSKGILKENGYFVDNLWHIDDVRLKYKDVSKDDAQRILDRALTNEATMEQIWFAIDSVAEAEGFVLLYEKEE
jgi:hypothetical protein